MNNSTPPGRYARKRAYNERCDECSLVTFATTARPTIDGGSSEWIAVAATIEGAIREMARRRRELLEGTPPQ